MREKTVMVFKIQIPIFHTGSPEALCYNKDRSIIGQFKLTKDLLKLFKDGEFRIFVFANYDEKTGMINIVKKTTEKSWEEFGVKGFRLSDVARIKVVKRKNKKNKKKGVK